MRTSYWVHEVHGVIDGEVHVAFVLQAVISSPAIRYNSCPRYNVVLITKVAIDTGKRQIALGYRLRGAGGSGGDVRHHAGLKSE